MKPRRLKKGFTLVELLVVIAILAILAGVSVIGYLSFTGQAKESADQQAVTQMNIALQAQEAVDAPDDVEEAKTVLKDAGFAVDDYVPLEKQNIFYYDQQSNRVLIFDQEDKKVTFPQEMADKYSNTSEKVGYWFLLNNKTYEWVEFAPGDTSSIQAMTAAFEEKVAGLTEMELLRLDSDITIGGDTAPSGPLAQYDFAVNETNDVHVDLNGHTITFDRPTAFNASSADTADDAGHEGSYTFSNGKIIAEWRDGAFTGATTECNTAISVEENSNLTLNDCEFVFNPNSNARSNQFGVKDYGKLTLSNCTITCGSGYTTGIYLGGVESETNVFNSNITSAVFGITSNADMKSSWNIKVKVDNSSVTSTKSAGILLNVPGKYDISDSTVKGDGQSTIIRGGTATFENCVLIEDGNNLNAVGNPDFSLCVSDPHMGNGTWKAGATLQFGGLIIGDWSSGYTYDTYCKLINTEVHMNDTWDKLPIIYASQDGANKTTLEYDSSCKFYKGTSAFTADEGIVKIGNNETPTAAKDKSLTIGTIDIHAI